MFAKLLVIAGPDRGKRFEVVPAVPLVVGRGREVDARLSDPRVSPLHCKLSVRNATLFVMDLDSLTGTAVNNVFVTVEYPLQLGDTFTLGDSVVLVQDPDAPDPPDMKAAAAAPPAPKAAVPKPATSPAAKSAASKSATSKPAPPVPAPAARAAPATDLPDRPEQLTGHTLSHYQVGPLMFRARLGFVFTAQDQKANRPVALKVMPAGFSQDPKQLTQFTRAMKLALPLRNRNVVPVLGAGKTGPYCWTAMELVNGESLTATVRHIGVAGSLDWRRALRMCIYIARGLTYLHEQQVVYRNVGPQNILCEGEARTPRLSDFQRAKPFYEQVEPGQGDELPEALLLYAAPEQTREETEIDYRSDIFNFGALSYSLLTGRPPFEGGSLAETITKIRREKPEDPKKYQLAIPKAFEGVVLQMLAKRPEDRYQTTAEVLRDLERVLKYQGMTLETGHRVD
jgi:Protein kinase domain/Inner membrane component of T3SS, cytoplasmic domain